ncbi:MAG: hypothetical protein AABY30_05515, partial [Candidatus Thermoplasmatota archaeon]
MASIDRGATWHGSRQVNLIYGQSSTCGPVVTAADQRGILHIVWERGGAEGNQDGIYYATAPRDRPVTHVSQQSSRPSIIVDAYGRSHLLWVDDRSGDGDFVGFARDGSNRLYGLKHIGRVLRSSNSGVSWAYRGTVASETFIALDTNRGTKTVVLAEFGRVYESTDGGITWAFLADIANRIDFRDLDIQTNTATYYALAADGQLYVSSNGGTTWSVHSDAGADVTFVSVEADTAPTLYALTRGDATSAPRVYVYSGSVWTLDFTFSLSLRFFSLESTPAGDVFALAETGEVYRRAAPGSWTVVGDVGANSDYRRVVSDSTGTLFVLRQAGTTLSSTNGGATWSNKGNAGLDGEVYYTQLDPNGRRIRRDTRVTTDLDNTDGLDQFSAVLALRVDPVSGAETLWAFWANLYVDDIIPNL